MARLKNANWNCGVQRSDGTMEAHSVEHSQLSVLMDIRDELKALNGIFACPNFLGMPRELKKLRIAVDRKRRKKRSVP